MLQINNHFENCIFIYIQRKNEGLQYCYQYWLCTMEFNQNIYKIPNNFESNK